MRSATGGVGGGAAGEAPVYSISEVVSGSFSGRNILGLSAGESAVVLQLWSHIRKKDFVTAEYALGELKLARLISDEKGEEVLESLKDRGYIESTHFFGSRHTPIPCSMPRSDLTVIAEKIFTGQYSFDREAQESIQASEIAPYPRMNNARRANANHVDASPAVRNEILPSKEPMTPTRQRSEPMVSEIDKKILKLLGEDKTGASIGRKLGIPQLQISKRLRDMEKLGMTRRENLDQFSSRLREKGLSEEQIGKILVPYKRLGYHWVPAEGHYTVARAPEESAAVPEQKEKAQRRKPASDIDLLRAWQDTRSTKKTGEITNSSDEHMHNRLRNLGALVRRRVDGRCLDIAEQSTMWPVYGKDGNNVDIAEGVHIIDAQMERVAERARLAENPKLARHFERLRRGFRNGLKEFAERRRKEIEKEQISKAREELRAAAKQIDEAAKQAPQEVVARLLAEKLDPDLVRLIRRESMRKSRSR